MSEKTSQTQYVLGEMRPSKAITKLSIPATLALLAKAVYNLVDTAYIGMLDSDVALTAVGVTVPLLLIMVSIENIFAAGAAVFGRTSAGIKRQRSCQPHSYKRHWNFCDYRCFAVCGRYRLPDAFDASLWRLRGISAIGKRLCILDVCSSIGKPSGPEYELRRKSGVICEDILDCRYYRCSTEYRLGSCLYV